MFCLFFALHQKYEMGVICSEHNALILQNACEIVYSSQEHFKPVFIPAPAAHPFQSSRYLFELKIKFLRIMLPFLSFLYEKKFTQEQLS